MLARLIELSLANRLLVLLATIGLVVAGVVAFAGLPIDAYPNIAPTQVKLILKAPGMTPEEVEQNVIAPLEMELLGVPRGSVLRSTAKYAIADITLDFEEGTDIYWARQQVSERLGNLSDSLPDGISGGMAPITTPLGEMFMFTVDGTTLSLVERRSLLDWVIRPALRSVPGVADVNALGGKVHSFEVVLDPVKMSALGLSAAKIKSSIEANNRNDGAGRLGEGDEVLLVRSEGSIRTKDDLKAIVVKYDKAGSVRLQDVAQVRDGSVTRYGVVTMDG